MSEDPLPEPREPVLRPPTRGANWRLTGLVLGILLALVVVKLAINHPQPNASHASPAAAAVGYIDALRSGSLSSVEAYLAPAERAQAPAELAALKADHMLLVSPVIEGSLGEGRDVTVDLTVEVCYRRESKDPYTCRVLQHEPLGLPSTLQSIQVGKLWYISTVLEPEPLG